MKIGNGHWASLFVLACGTIHAGNVVTDWNSIASTTIVTNGVKVSSSVVALVRLHGPRYPYDAVNS